MLIGSGNGASRLPETETSVDGGAGVLEVFFERSESEEYGGVGLPLRICSREMEITLLWHDYLWGYSGHGRGKGLME